MTTKKVAIYPGSFNPFHAGHFNIVGRALGVFDEIVILIGINPGKKQDIPVEIRLKWIKKIIEQQSEVWKDKVRVDYTEYPIYKYCYTNKIFNIVKGVRDAKDFEYEDLQAKVNNELISNFNFVKQYYWLETFLLPSDNFCRSYSSSLIRQLMDVLSIDEFIKFADRYFPSFTLISKDSYIPEMLREFYESYHSGKYVTKR